MDPLHTAMTARALPASSRPWEECCPVWGLNILATPEAAEAAAALPRLGAELELRRSGSSLGPSQ